MRKLRLFVATALVAVACTSSSPYRLNLKPYELVGTDFPLPSGLRVFFQEDHQQPSVMVAATVGVGAAQDPVGQEGMAHLVEHLNFIAKPDGKVKLWDRLQLMGSRWNAYTSKDITHYHTVAAKEYLPELLEYEARRLINAVDGVTEEELKTEREVVRNELRQGEEDKYSNGVWDKLNEMVYPPDHPYHDSVIGTHASLLTIKLEDVQAWVKKHYRPDNVTIVVTGDFDPQEAGALLGKAFPPQLLAAPGKEDQPIEPVEPKVRITGPSPEPPPLNVKTIEHMRGPVDRTQIWLGWSLPGAYRGKDWMMDITALNLQNAIASLLYPKDEFDEELVSDLGCFTDSRIQSTIAACYIELFEGEDPEETARAAVDGIWELWDQQIHEWRRRDIGYASTYFMTGTFARSASLVRATEIANFMHWTGHPDYFSAMIRELGTIKELEARDFAFKYLNRDRVATLIVEPFTGDEPEASMRYQQAGEWYGSTAEKNPELAAAFEKMKNEEIEKIVVIPDLSTVRELTLPNGLRAVLKKHGSAPFTKVLLLTGGGPYNSMPLYLPSLLMREDRAPDPLKVASLWSAYNMPQNAFQAVEGPSGNLEALIDLLASRVETAFVRWEVVPYKNRLKREKKRQETERRDPIEMMHREVDTLLLADHPLAQHDLNLDVFARLGKKHFEQWQHRTMAPANATLYVIGDIDLDQAEAYVKARWSRWRQGSPGVPMAPFAQPGAPPERQMVFIDKPERTQADIQVKCLLQPFDKEKGSIVSDVVGSLLGYDLMQAIRETGGASYGVHVSPMLHNGGTSVMTIGGNVQNAFVAPALKTILDRVGELGRGEIERSKLNQAKVKGARAFRTQFLGIDDMLGWLMEFDRMDMPLDRAKEIPALLAGVGNDDIVELLAPCAGHEIIGVVGPLFKLEQPLKELGIPLKVGERVEEKKAEDKEKSD